MSYIVEISLPEISCVFQMFTFVTSCCSPHISTSQQKSSIECLIWCQSWCVRILPFDRLRGLCHSTVSNVAYSKAYVRPVTRAIFTSRRLGIIPVFSNFRRNSTLFLAKSMQQGILLSSIVFNNCCRTEYLKVNTQTKHDRLQVADSVIAAVLYFPVLLHILVTLL